MNEVCFLYSGLLEGPDDPELSLSSPPLALQRPLLRVDLDAAHRQTSLEELGSLSSHLAPLPSVDEGSVLSKRFAARSSRDLALETPRFIPRNRGR